MTTGMNEPRRRTRQAMPIRPQDKQDFILYRSNAEPRREFGQPPAAPCRGQASLDHLASW